MSNVIQTLVINTALGYIYRFDVSIVSENKCINIIFDLINKKTQGIGTFLIKTCLTPAVTQ